MAYNYGILLGRITKVSGYEGAVIVKLENIFTENIPQMESVFLEIEGRPVPFFIADLEYSGADILKLWFDGYDSDKKTTEFIGCRIFFTSDKYGVKLKKNNQDVVGYKVIIQENEELGTITEVIENNGQWLINIISQNKKSILIPFHEHFILSVDKRKKVILMDLPEGLTDIN
jgi:16S rRNA processing protein RimM